MKTLIRQISISIISGVVLLGLTQPAPAMTAEQAVEAIKVWDTYYQGIQRIFAPPAAPQPPTEDPAPAPNPEYSQPEETIEQEIEY